MALPQIKYDPRFSPPSEEVLQKLRLSCIEYENREKKVLNCPICGFRILGASADRQGLIEVKCRKCKFEGPINLAYFRTQRRRVSRILLPSYKKKKPII